MYEYLTLYKGYVALDRTLYYYHFTKGKNKNVQ